MEQGPGLKQRLWRMPNRLPLARETADPVVFVVLALFSLGALLAFALATKILPHDDDARSHVLQLCAGLLLVFGGYYTCVSIRERRAEQCVGRLCELIGRLGDPSDAVRIGAIRLIESLALETPALPSDTTSPPTREARIEAMLGALEAVAKENRPGVSPLAAEVHQRLNDHLRP